MVSLPGLVLLVLPGLGRAFGAVFLREVGGSAPVVLAFDALRGLGAWRRRRDVTFVPLTRAGFWERLGQPDSASTEEDGTRVFRGLLPHLTWERGRRISTGRDVWQVEAEAPRLDGKRLVYGYRLHLLRDPSVEGEPPPVPPPANAYPEEVLAGVRREWDDWNASFAWYTSLLGSDVQARAFDHRGGPSAVRRATRATAAFTLVLGLYLASFLAGGPPGDPLAPAVALVGAALVFDTMARHRAVRRGLYAPSLLRLVLPSDPLRPERLAFHAHRDAESRVLEGDRSGRTG